VIAFRAEPATIRRAGAEVDARAQGSFVFFFTLFLWFFFFYSPFPLVNCASIR